MSTKYIASNWRLPNKAGVDSYLNDNYGLSFNGSNQVINIDNSSDFDLGSAFTISGWFNFSSNKYQGLISFDSSSTRGWFLFQFLDNSILLFNGVTSFTLKSSYTTTNQWDSFILTYDGTDLVFYINGVQESTQAVSINLQTNGNDGQIGNNQFSTGRYFSGSISELTVFNYALSSTQISTLYGSSSLGAGNPMALKPAPVAFYPLGDNSSGNPLTQPNEAVEDASVFSFNGSNDYIDLNFQSQTTPATISIWVNTDVNDSQQRYAIINGRADQTPYLYLRMATDNTYQVLFFNSNGSDTLQGSSATINTWFHFAIVCEDSQTLLYENGILKDSSTIGWSGINIDQSNNWELGRDSRGMRFWKGQLSNTQIWNTALSSSEVETLYNSGVPLMTGTQPQASNLKAWYKLDQSANWEADSSGAWQIPDAVSAYPQSFDFNGSNDYITVGNPSELQFTSDFSISGWFKSSSATSQRIVSKDDGSNRSYFIQLSAAGAIEAAIYTSGVKQQNDSASGFADGNWHHFVFTFENGVGTKLYIDNGTPTTDSATGTLDNDTNDFEIGRREDGSKFFNGQLSNIQAFNSTLPATGTDSVETLYNNGVPLTTAIASDNLKLWAKLDNTATFSTNWSIPDASGNGNTGTSSGMTEQNLVNNNVSALNGESNGMTSASLVLSDLSRNLPYDSYSFNFDSASSDYINIGAISSINSTSSCTISYWCKKASASGNDMVVGSQITSTNGIWLQWFTDNNIYFSPRNGGLNFVSVALTGDTNWHHLVGVYDGTNMSIYIDGSEAATSTTSVPASLSATAGDNFQIGAIGTSFFTDGSISNVSIFDEALTSTEVMKLYSNGMPQDLTSFTPAPVAWWTLGSNSFFNGTNFICKDLIGSNDGTSVNAGVDALQGNTPRSEANGTGTNMDIPTNLEGSTKYSSNNSWSINMSESARVADTP